MPLRPFALERYFAKYEFATRFLLCSSDPESVTTRELLDLEPGAHERFLNHWLGYTESTGSPTLRAEAGKLYTTIDPAEILCFAGAEEGIYWFMHASLLSDDHIIVHAPCYQSHTEVARAIGTQVTEWRARAENNWQLDVDELRRLIQPNTRMILINTPHNPTGALMSSADFAAVNAIAQEHGIVLFSDEVFREFEHDPADRLAAACDVNPTAVSLGVLSKTYGLAGLRIGWIATHNQRIRERMASLKDYTTICNSAPSEFLAEVALRHRAVLAGRALQIVRGNLTLLDDFFVRHAGLFSWVRPIASAMAFPKLHVGLIEAYADALARESGVLLLPGSVFGDSNNHFRLGFGRKNMPEALGALEQFIAHHKLT